MNKNILIVIVFLVLSNCNLPVDDNPKEERQELPELEIPYSLDIVSALKNNADFKLSDFGDSLSYVPLKGLPEMPIVFLLNVELDGEEIFVFASHRTGILRFSKNGDLINRIGSYGNGPGELSPGSRFSLSLEEKLVYVQRNYTYNVLGFTYEGEYLGDLITDEKKLSSKILPLSAICLETIERMPSRAPIPEA